MTNEKHISPPPSTPYRVQFKVVRLPDTVQGILRYRICFYYIDSTKPIVTLIDELSIEKQTHNGRCRWTKLTQGISSSSDRHYVRITLCCEPLKHWEDSNIKWRMPGGTQDGKLLSSGNRRESGYIALKDGQLIEFGVYN